MLINKHDESIESVCSLRFLATDRLSLKRASLCDITLNGTSTQKIAIILLNTQEENKRLLALQAPSDSTQNVQYGDFVEKMDNSSAKEQKPSEDSTDTKKATSKSWWHFW